MLQSSQGELRGGSTWGLQPASALLLHTCQHCQGPISGDPSAGRVGSMGCVQ